MNNKQCAHLVLGLILVVGFYLFMKGPKTPKIKVSFEKSSYEVTVGKKFAVPIMLETKKDKHVSAGTASVSYPPNVLKYDSAGFSNSCNVGFSRSFFVRHDAIAGKITFSRGVFEHRSLLPSGSFCFAVVNFVPLKQSSYPSEAVVAFYQGGRWEFAGRGEGTSAMPERFTFKFDKEKSTTVVTVNP